MNDNDEQEAQRTAAVAELLKLGEDEAMSDYITIPEHLKKRDQLGPSIRKLLVDEARSENQRRYAENARETRQAALRAAGEVAQ